MGKMCDGGDCHYLVMDTMNGKLIEVYQASTDGVHFSSAGSIAIWDFNKAYPASLRGDVCTSADASGGMMAPLLFTVEEVAAGHIDHAVRFILPNSRIQFKEYVRPATHGTGATGWAMMNGVPYGARFRLKPAFDTSALSAGAKVVAAALKKYGMIMSDGGNVAFTAKSDQFSTMKWAGVLAPQDLASIQPTDFEMVQATYGTDQVSSTMRYDFTSYTCTRNP
jgi:serine/threonine-protein kinase